MHNATNRSCPCPRPHRGPGGRHCEGQDATAVSKKEVEAFEDATQALDKMAAEAAKAVNPSWHALCKGRGSKQTVAALKYASRSYAGT